MRENGKGPFPLAARPLRSPRLSSSDVQKCVLSESLTTRPKRANTTLGDTRPWSRYRPGSYTFAKNLSDAQSYNPSAFATEGGGTTTDPNNIGLAGNVAYTRRNRVLATFLYELPFGKGKMLASNVNSALDQVIGGWELAGVALFQSGPWLTVTVPSADPSGTGFASNVGNGRANIVSGHPLDTTDQTLSNWINKAAFAVPANNIATWPSSPVGVMQGPGTQAISISLMKAVHFTESRRLQFGMHAANLFNHPNYAPPNEQWI